MTSPGYKKVDAVDMLYDPRKTITFWTDHQNKRVQCLSIDTNTISELSSDVDSNPTTIITGLFEPRGLSVDWVAKRLYITDRHRILVASLDGKFVYTLITGNIKQPRDIVVAPVQGLLFWCDWGPVARIETAYMDGKKTCLFFYA